jgi:heme o synthase
MASTTCPPTSDTSSRPEARTFLWKSLLVLFKIRVVVLLLFAAVGGAFLAAGGWPGTARLALLLIAGGSAAAGASAINQYLEKGLDARMERTRDRPLAGASPNAGRWVPYAGALMILLPSLAILPINPPLSLFVLAGAAVYIYVYTIWLKPRTPLNIVLGGAAGSMAVLSGSAAAGQWNEPGAVILALLVFLWTPTHFWSLAIAYRDDYARGGFPMLPVQITPRAAAGWVLIHTAATALAALALASHSSLGWLYLAPVSLSTAVLLGLSGRLLANPGKQRAMAIFHGSNLYLALVMLTICLDTAIL